MSRIIAVVGLASEAAIAAGPQVAAVIAGAARGGLAARLDQAVAAGADGVISFGLAGGLDPDLGAGRCIVASAVLAGAELLPADAAWADRLMRQLAGAQQADIVGVDRPIADVADKQALYRSTGAAAVDMESATAAHLAAARGLPFAALRVICDPAGRAVPPAALAGFGADGRTDLGALLRALAAAPGQLPALLRLAGDARRAFAELSRCRRILGSSLGFGG